jgi:hypothetical protein
MKVIYHLIYQAKNYHLQQLKTHVTDSEGTVTQSTLENTWTEFEFLMSSCLATRSDNIAIY